MLNEEEVRALIVARLQNAEQCNGHFINHLRGQVRALLSVLLDGEYPPNFDDLGDILTLAKIPFEYDKEKNVINFPKDWCRAHGFEVNGDHIRHPRFSKSW